MPRTKVYHEVVNVTPKIVSRDANNVTWLSYTADIMYDIMVIFSFQFNQNREMIFDRNPEYFKEKFRHFIWGNAVVHFLIPPP